MYVEYYTLKDSKRDLHADLAQLVCTGSLLRPLSKGSSGCDSDGGGGGGGEVCNSLDSIVRAVRRAEKAFAVKIR